MEIVKRLILSISILYVYGCAYLGTKSLPLEVRQFPSVGLNFKVQGSREDVRSETVQFLSSRLIPAKQEIQEPHVYVITAYLGEPEKDGDRRVRKTAYRISLQTDSDHDSCTNSSVTWLVQSRGIRERTWRTVESDSNYTPSTLSEFTELFSGRPCNE